MKILVTGANGYIGEGVIRELLETGHEVIATDFSLNHVDDRAVKVTANLFDITDPYDFFEKPDVLLHLAWRDGFKHNSLCHIKDLPKHYEFIQSIIEGGISQVCIMGSMHEIGFYEGSIDESTPTNPQSLYGISKNALRQSIELLQKETDFIFQWIRGFYIVGNVEHGCSVFSKLADAERRGQKVFPFTTGDNQFDFLDYKEFCNQVISVVLQNEINGVINCCSGRPMRLGERVERFIKENGYSIRLDYGAFPDRPYDSKAIWGNNRKINSILKSID